MTALALAKGLNANLPQRWITPSKERTAPVTWLLALPRPQTVARPIPAVTPHDAAPQPICIEALWLATAPTGILREHRYDAREACHRSRHSQKGSWARRFDNRLVAIKIRMSIIRYPATLLF